MHGSGKTAVLSERIVKKVVEENIDIDKILVVTFTNASASEMKDRILTELYKKLDENPDDVRLQKQTLLINKANICTIDSFCLDVIKNHFYKSNINPGFRIAEGTEIEILKQEVLEETLEEKYEENKDEFKNLINIYTGINDDNSLKELIIRIFEFIQSNPYPIKWLEEQVETFNLKEEKEDFSNNKLGQIIIQSIKQELENNIKDLAVLEQELENIIEASKQLELTKEYKYNMEQILYVIDNWDKTYELINKLTFGRLPGGKSKLSLETRIYVKNIFAISKDIYSRIVKTYFTAYSENINKDMKFMYVILKEISEIIKIFSDKFKKRKKEKNILDFNDIEHYALEMLLEDNKPTDVANSYKEKFNEILIDEYQDSNLVQEYILWSVSNGNNVFMVGDVKQSIYKFRQARPELFLEKYYRYKEKEGTSENEDIKIKLYKNFRSRAKVLDFVNLVFKTIMSKELGDIEYTEDEFLNYGASYDESKENILDGKTEINIINLKKEEFEETEDDIEYAESEESILKNNEIESIFVAKKIKELINSKCLVTTKTGTREIMYKDMVILFRGTKSNAPIFEKMLGDFGIPVYSDISNEYLNSIEISTIMSLLKIIDNPFDDISFVTVLRSDIGKFTDNELIDIRLINKKGYMYENFKILAKENKKHEAFLSKLEIWKEKQEFMPLDQFIWMLYLETGYYDFVKIMPDGILKQANLKILFQRAKQYEDTSFKGLFNFIQYIEKLKKADNDLGSAKLISENENVVKIMSIHKSKGLEFPVVFLSGTGGGFNLSDLKGNILLHQNLGIGAEYINYERRITYPTIVKEAIKIALKKENLSEEMRVLYVALTRAKEKLIITGCVNDLDKSMNEKEQILESANKNEKISSSILLNAKSFLDWMQLIVLFNNEEIIKNLININHYTKEDILTEKIQENIVEEEILAKENIEKIKYKYEESINIPSKMSVTDIKKKDKQDEKIELNSTPKFLKDDIRLTKAQIGTVMHYVIQKLDIKEYTVENVLELINYMKSKNMITDIEADSVDISKVVNLTKSDLYKRMRSSKEVHKEVPFYINISSEELFEGSNEKVLIQGIIDCYFIDENDKLVLLDYKTDFVNDGKTEELVNKYTEQLELYKRALENALQRKVDEVYIYSIYLDKDIAIKS